MWFELEHQAKNYFKTLPHVPAYTNSKKIATNVKSNFILGVGFVRKGRSLS